MYSAARAAWAGFFSVPVTRFGKRKGSVAMPFGVMQGSTNAFVIGCDDLSDENNI